MNAYTIAAALAALIAVGADLLVFHTALVRSRTWWMAYGIVVFFQLVTNGWLTGRGIVRYSDAVIVGSERVVFFGDGRIAYAPVEDLLFGFALVVQTLSWWVFWGRRLNR